MDPEESRCNWTVKRVLAMAAAIVLLAVQASAAFDSSWIGSVYDLDSGEVSEIAESDDSASDSSETSSGDNETEEAELTEATTPADASYTIFDWNDASVSASYTSIASYYAIVQGTYKSQVVSGVTASGIQYAEYVLPWQYYTESLDFQGFGYTGQIRIGNDLGSYQNYYTYIGGAASGIVLAGECTFDEPKIAFQVATSGYFTVDQSLIGATSWESHDLSSTPTVNVYIENGSGGQRRVASFSWGTDETIQLTTPVSGFTFSLIFPDVTIPKAVVFGDDGDEPAWNSDIELGYSVTPAGGPSGSVPAKLYYSAWGDLAATQELNNTSESITDSRTDYAAAEDTFVDSAGTAVDSQIPTDVDSYTPMSDSKEYVQASSSVVTSVWDAIGTPLRSLIFVSLTLALAGFLIGRVPRN